MTVTSSLLH